MNKFSPDILLSLANSNVSTAFNRFVLKTANHGLSTIYGFVEGYDLSYYSVRVESITGLNSEFIEAKGKTSVIGIYNFISSKPEYKKYKILYFIDRDYDDNSCIDSDIYVTPGYAVENFYGTERSYKKIIQGIYHIDEDNPKFSECIKLYNREKNMFIAAVAPLCAWYKCIKKKQHQGVELGETFPSKYADIGPLSIYIKNNSLETIVQDFPNCETVTKEEFNVTLLEVKQDINNIRGKYVMQFIEYLIKILNNDSRTRKIYTDNKVSFEQNFKTLLARLSTYAETTECLRKYIIRTIYKIS